MASLAMNSDPFTFDTKHLMALARAHRDAYAQAEPFPHAVLDDFLPEGVARRLVDEFPPPAEISRHHESPSEHNKHQWSDEAGLPDFTRHVVWAFNSAAFVRFLTELTGINGLITDPTLCGGGLHLIRRGGWLGVHADFPRHKALDVERRLNVLLFLNSVWEPSWGGTLELWAHDMSACVQRIEPVWNRCVIFNVTDRSFHGHPTPLACPDDVYRRSLALYYYSSGRPAGETVQRPNTTIFRRRPGTADLDNRIVLRVVHYLRKFIPPILIDLKRAFERGNAPR
jgi:hypothetical protein